MSRGAYGGARAHKLHGAHKLRRRRPGIPVGHDAVPCWLRSLFTLELLAAAVGPMPAHSWREDYIELHHQAP